jgi:xanthine dehydrogenase YagR molybdenum-binding subunit
VTLDPPVQASLTAGASLAEYHVPVHADVPDIDIVWSDIPDPLASAGAKGGVGEIGVTGVAAAIANAVYHATGKRIGDLPITPDKILTTLPATGTVVDGEGSSRA